MRLHYPDRASRAPSSTRPGGWGVLEFNEPDDDTFPAMRLARAAGARGDRATCAFNAANEVAVHAFLDGRSAHSWVYQRRWRRSLAGRATRATSEHMKRWWTSILGKDRAAAKWSAV